MRSAVPQNRSQSALKLHLVLCCGLLAGSLFGALGFGWVFAGQDRARDAEIASFALGRMYLEYTVDSANPSVRWADLFSMVDSFLLLRFQSEPDQIYLTSMTPNNPGLPQPHRIKLGRDFQPGEKVYVYLMDDDSLSDAFWKFIAKEALVRGGAVSGRLLNNWSLGQVPTAQVNAFFESTAEYTQTMTFDGNDFLACAVVSIPEITSVEAAKANRSLSFMDAHQQSAGTLSYAFELYRPQAIKVDVSK